MSLQIATIPCREDNYAFLLHDKDSGETALVDAPEAAPVIEVLESRGWTLTHILITHHHYDHIDGVEELRAKYGAKVVGSKADAARLPALDIELSEGDTIKIGENEGKVLDVSGHCNNHLAFHFPRSFAVFTGDSLMALGCGRLFEGTPQQMWESLSKIAALPKMTIVYSGHEYTLGNAKFSQSIEPDNAGLQARVKDAERLRAAGLPTVPSLLSLELATNPFLRAKDAASFAKIRTAKDNF
jgi:hydroxyacylglutathione hydrolase